MRLSFSNCHFTYLRIFSSSSTTVLTQYPLAQKCLPQYLFLSSRCLFRKPIVSDTANFGGTDMTKCTWSSRIFISKISSFFHSHNWVMISMTDFCTAPFKILNRYLGHHTIWYLHCHIACANLLKSLIGYLLLSFGSPTHILRRYSFWLYPSFSKTKMSENQAYSGIEVHLGCTEFTGNLNTHSRVVRVCG
jgi:hypothetical protein